MCQMLACSFKCFWLLTLRNIIQKVERKENVKHKASLVSELVEWQFQHHNGTMVSFDRLTNLSLEEALEKKQSVKIKINSHTYLADVMRRRAASKGRSEVELLRKDKKKGQ